MEKINLTDKLICITLLCFAVVSCSHESLSGFSSGTEDINEPLVKSPMTSDNIVYDESTSTWYTYQKDPYSLENFQQAYEDLLNTPTIINMLNLNASTLPVTLNPTHYCLKIYPKTEEEQWTVELMDDVDVLYAPFDYAALPEQSEIDVNTSNCATFETSPYSVIYKSITTEGDSLSETVTLPILYAVWPVDKPLPTQYEYKVVRTAFIPGSNSNSTISANTAINGNGLIFDEKFLNLLEQKAVGMALGTENTEWLNKSVNLNEYISDVDFYTMCHGRFVNVLEGFEAPLSNLRVRVVLGSKVETLYTDDNGIIQCVLKTSSSASVQCYLLDKYWKVTHSKKSAPVLHTLGTLGDIFKSSRTIGPKKIIVNHEKYPYYQIQRAANFYYYGVHELGKAWIKKGTRIIAAPMSQNNSCFTYSIFCQPYITIYNEPNSHRLIGTVLHELGHLHHYALIDSDWLITCYNTFRKMPQLIKESYASYTGWVVGKRYFQLIGAYIDDSKNTTGQSRQNWEKTDKSNYGWYSPLFVDLFDDFNQNRQGVGGVSENISNFSHSVIYDIAKNSRSWSSVRSKLQQKIGTYYSESEFNAYVAPYDYYFGY